MKIISGKKDKNLSFCDKNVTIILNQYSIILVSNTFMIERKFFRNQYGKKGCRYVYTRGWEQKHYL